MNKIDLVTKKMQCLSPDQQKQVLDFVEFLIAKYQPENSQKSAEQRAIERIKDLDDPDNPEKWETAINIDDEIDVESSLENLTREREVPNAVSMGMKANTISLFMVL